MQTAKTTSTGRPLLVDQVLGSLTSYIRSEGLCPGDRLPSEAELVNRMQCSRNWPRTGYLQRSAPLDVLKCLACEAFLNNNVRQDTLMHYACEAFLNNVRIPDSIASTTEFLLYRKFLSTMQGLTAYRTEWVI